MGNQPSVPQPGVRLQVIGAGLPRTGTTSLTEALRILLDGPVHHGITQISGLPEAEILSWIKILSLKPGKSDKDKAMLRKMLRERLDGYVACTDAPACGFFPESMEEYPEALVICTTRDPTSWAKSMDTVATIFTKGFLRLVLFPLPTLRHFVDYINGLRDHYLDRYGQAEPLDADVYTQHMEWLKKTVPADKLVFFDVKDGWEPLCKALGKEVPKIPFPKLNDSQAIEKASAEKIVEGLKTWAAYLGIASLLGAVSWFITRP